MNDLIQTAKEWLTDTAAKYPKFKLAVIALAVGLGAAYVIVKVIL